MSEELGIVSDFILYVKYDNDCTQNEIENVLKVIFQKYPDLKNIKELKKTKVDFVKGVLTEKLDEYKKMYKESYDNYTLHSLEHCISLIEELFKKNKIKNMSDILEKKIIYFQECIEKSSVDSVRATFLKCMNFCKELRKIIQ